MVFLLKFLLLFWWLMLVKTQAAVEQMRGRDTPNLNIDIQNFRFSFSLFCPFRALVCVFLTCVCFTPHFLQKFSQWKTTLPKCSIFFSFSQSTLQNLRFWVQWIQGSPPAETIMPNFCKKSFGPRK